MRKYFVRLLIISFLTYWSAYSQASEIIQLNAGIHVIHAELANTLESRTKGLMFRNQLLPNQGMLFVFENRGIYCFWMRNTSLPLSIAFLDEDGTIINIEDMAPQTETQHCSKKSTRYALEMTQGWFKQKGFETNMKLGGLKSR